MSACEEHTRLLFVRTRAPLLRVLDSRIFFRCAVFYFDWALATLNLVIVTAQMEVFLRKVFKNHTFLKKIFHKSVQIFKGIKSLNKNNNGHHNVSREYNSNNVSKNCMCSKKLKYFDFDDRL